MRTYDEAQRLHQQGKLEEALIRYRRALAKARREEDEAYTAIILNDLGGLYIDMGRPDMAVKILQESLELMQEEVFMDEGEATVLENLAIALCAVGQYQEALAHCENALETWSEIDRPESMASTLSTRGDCQWALGNLEDAAKSYEQSIVLLRSIGDTEMEMKTLWRIGDVYRENDQPQKALESLKRAVKLARKHANRYIEGGALNSLGGVYFQLGDMEEAGEILLQAEKISRDMEDPECEAKSSENLGMFYQQRKRFDAALEYFKKALKLRREIDDQGGEIRILRYLGDVLTALGRPGEAMKHYENSLKINEQVDETWNQIKTHRLLGEMSFNRKRYEDAVEHYKKALQLSLRSEDKSLRATVLHSLGVVYKQMGQFSEALSHLEEAQARLTKLGLNESAAESLYGMGIIHGENECFTEAITCHREALKLLQGRDKPNQVVKNKERLCELHRHLGHYKEADQYFREALNTTRSKGIPDIEGKLLLNMGVACQNQMRLQDALGYYHQALAVFRKTGNLKFEGHALQYLSVLFIHFDFTDEALEYCEEALDCFHQISAPSEEADVYTSIARVHSRQLNWNAALHYLQKALTLSRESGDRRKEQYALLELSWVYEQLENLNQAFHRCHQARDICRKFGEQMDEGDCLCYLGDLYRKIERLDEAQNFYQEALAIAGKARHHWGEASALAGLGSICSDQHQLNKAEDYYKKAIEIAESSRREILSPDIRSTHFSSFHYIYLNCIMVSIEQGKLANAHHFAERRTARTFLDLLGEANAQIEQGIDPPLLQKERQLLTQLNGVRQRLEGLNSKQNSKLATELRKQEQDIERLYQIHQADVRKRNPGYANLVQLDIWNVEEIQRELLDENTAFLHYVLDDPISHLFVILRQDIKVFRLPGKEAIEVMVRQLREAVIAEKSTETDFNWYEPEQYINAFELYKALIKPTEHLIEGKHLIVTPDGALNYIPFAMLLTEPPRRPGAFSNLPYLIRRHSISYTSSASVAGFLMKKRCSIGDRCWSKQFVAFADPLEVPEKSPHEIGFSPALESVRVQIRHGGGFDSLPATHDEVVRIASLFEESSRLKRTLNRNIDSYDDCNISLRLRSCATKEAVIDCFDSKTGDQSPRFVHFATHGILNEEKPQFSGLVLSPGSKEHKEDPFWHTFEIFNSHIPADMVVLSACETGLGQEITGEGLVGLTRAFFHAGATSVCASLWKVADSPTADLMVAFYRQLLQKPVGNKFSIDKAEALQQAQLDLINGGGWTAHPFCWASFVLIGERT